MYNTDKKTLIEKLYKGICTEEEFEEVFQLARSLSQEEAAPIMEKLWEQMTDYPRLAPALSSRIYEDILVRIPKDQGEKVVALPGKTSRRRTFLRIAASILFLVFSAVIMQWVMNSDTTIVATHNMEQQVIELPDGSVVQLNANSKLRFPKKWDNETDRKVWLEGEAFFKVSKRHASGQKFLVFTPDLTVQVLGTKFNVNTHRERTTVLLEEGEITLNLKNDKSAQKVMVPGELLSYSADEDIILANTKDTKVAVHTSWKDGVLTFYETPLKEVFKKIEEIYGIDLVVQGTLNSNREVTTGLPIEDLELVLPILEQALDIEINKNGNQYLVH